MLSIGLGSITTISWHHHSNHLCMMSNKKQRGNYSLSHILWLGAVARVTSPAHRVGCLKRSDSEDTSTFLKSSEILKELQSQRHSPNNYSMPSQHKTYPV